MRKEHKIEKISESIKKNNFTKAKRIDDYYNYIEFFYESENTRDDDEFHLKTIFDIPKNKLFISSYYNAKYPYRITIYR